MKIISYSITCACFLLATCINVSEVHAASSHVAKVPVQKDAIEPLSAVRQKDLLHLLKQDCGSCHGMTLKGGLGPSLLPEELEGKPEYFITLTILQGRPGTAMPPWKDILTEQEAKWIAQQLIKGLDNEQK